jgi:7-carboxy-7-deazaguanine synthase
MNLRADESLKCWVDLMSSGENELMEREGLRMSNTSLPIVETFHSVQGEGAWCGTNAYFIRLALCDVGCPWCDTKISWSDKKHPKMTIETLTQQAKVANPHFVVITGGEPLIHDLTDLTQALQSAGLRTHLETSGSHPYSGSFDWITLSPKPFKPPIGDLYDRAHELKLIISNPEDFHWAETQSNLTHPQALRYLQPEWNAPASQTLVFDYVLKNPQWRISLQTHKLLGVQ